MEEVRNLVEKGKIKQALERLLTLIKAEHEQEVTLLLSNYNAHQIDVMEGTQKQDTTLIARTNKAIIAICDEYEPSTQPKTFAEPPILDNLPLDKDGYLLGRKAALEQLHAALQGTNILTLVNGMGGIGKSTLASFYANFPTYKAAYSHCYWVSVSDLTGEVKQALINTFAEALALYQMPETTQLSKIQTYLSGLQGQTLLILDNANDKKKVIEALDFLRKCKIKVLFTSRANMSNIPAQALAKLLPEDAFTLFTHYFPAASAMPETPQLLKNIDYHTLLTEFMAKSLAHNPVLSLQDLVEITQQQNFTDELLAYTQFTTYHTNTHENPDAEIQPAEYLLQIFPIQNLSEQEQEILRYFSILPTEWIGIDMLLQLFAADKEKATHLQLGQVLQSLHEKGWLQKSPTNAFACHILVQHILRQELQPNAENCKLLLENLYAATWFDGYTNLLMFQSYLPLVAAILTWIKEDTELVSNIYHCSAAIYQAIGNYMQALSYDLENIRIKQKVLSADNTDLATAYNNIGVTYSYLGDRKKELEYKLNALAIRKKVLNAEHSDLAQSYNNIAITYKYLKDYRKALNYGLKDFAICKKILDSEHPNLANSYNNLSDTYRHLGDYKKSLKYGLKAISIQEKVLSIEHPNLANSYNNISHTYFCLKDYITAYSYSQKAVTICIKTLPEGHPHIQIVLDTKNMIEKAMCGE